MTATRRLLAVATAGLLAAGCGASAGGTEHPQQHHAAQQPAATVSGKPAQALTVRQLAVAVGCEPKLTGTTAGFRQAACDAGGATLVLVDFDTATAQRDWLDEAVPYGGSYLVGDRWAVSGGSRDYLATVQGVLGGNLEGASG
jgi:hypothetical protein